MAQQKKSGVVRALQVASIVQRVVHPWSNVTRLFRKPVVAVLTKVGEPLVNGAAELLELDEKQTRRLKTASKIATSFAVAAAIGGLSHEVISELDLDDFVDDLPTGDVEGHVPDPELETTEAADTAPTPDGPGASATGHAHYVRKPQFGHELKPAMLSEMSLEVGHLDLDPSQKESLLQFIAEVDRHGSEGMKARLSEALVELQSGDKAPLNALLEDAHHESGLSGYLVRTTKVQFSGRV